jgi:hypothetical protein
MEGSGRERKGGDGRTARSMPRRQTKQLNMQKTRTLKHVRTDVFIFVDLSQLMLELFSSAQSRPKKSHPASNSLLTVPRQRGDRETERERRERERA